ncbi:addiction module toxin, HicA family [Enterococcus mundtii]
MPMTQQEMVKLLISIGGLKVKGGKCSHIKVKLPTNHCSFQAT